VPRTYGGKPFNLTHCWKEDKKNVPSFKKAMRPTKRHCLEARMTRNKRWLTLMVPNLSRARASVWDGRKGTRQQRPTWSVMPQYFIWLGHWRTCMPKIRFQTRIGMSENTGTRKKTWRTTTMYKNEILRLMRPMPDQVPRDGAQEKGSRARCIGKGKGGWAQAMKSWAQDMLQEKLDHVNHYGPKCERLGSRRSKIWIQDRSWLSWLVDIYLVICVIVYELCPELLAIFLSILLPFVMNWYIFAKTGEQD
jgi:hypothetical protein